MCGGTGLRNRLGGLHNGLSPRVRGNRYSCVNMWRSLRSIPACAGEPGSQAPERRSIPVYPRVCGGTRTLLLLAVTFDGLSPRVRGNHTSQVQDKRRLGSIPACAGEPPPVYPRLFRRWVYPRVCGGTFGTGKTRQSRMGLSPRVRGNPLFHVTGTICNRSIPACAGEPLYCPSQASRSAVYPRVCGGTLNIPPDVSDTEGLSPRVRGNLLDALDDLPPARSIPACAGEPSAQVAMKAPRRVYPRVCGGTDSHHWYVLQVVGLSPRVRGNPEKCGPRKQSPGSIPACAGEPIQTPWSQWEHQVYPRVCGGTVEETFEPVGRVGLSPRVRGTP